MKRQGGIEPIFRRRVKSKWNGQILMDNGFFGVEILGEIAESFYGKQTAEIFSTSEMLVNYSAETDDEDRMLSMQEFRLAGEHNFRLGNRDFDKVGATPSNVFDDHEEDGERLVDYDNCAAYFHHLCDRYGQDYPRIASVFVNSLERFQRRQIDPLALSSLLHCLFHGAREMIDEFYTLALSPARRRERVPIPPNNIIPETQLVPVFNADAQLAHHSVAVNPAPLVAALSNGVAEHYFHRNGEILEPNQDHLQAFCHHINHGLADVVYRIFMDKLRWIQSLHAEGRRDEANDELNQLLALVPNSSAQRRYFHECFNSLIVGSNPQTTHNGGLPARSLRNGSNVASGMDNRGTTTVQPNDSIPCSVSADPLDAVVPPFEAATSNGAFMASLRNSASTTSCAHLSENAATQASSAVVESEPSVNLSRSDDASSDKPKK